MNRVVLVGRITKDPVLKRTTNDVPVVQFVIAVNRQFASQNSERQADFINCVVWKQQAENFAKYMRKGSLIGVDGRIQTRQYKDANQETRYATEVVCDQIQFLESKGAREGGFGDVNTYDELSSIPAKNEIEDNSQDTMEELNKLDTSDISSDDLPF